MISNAVFTEETFINKIYNYSDFEDNYKKYDLAIAFKRFPFIVYYDYSKIYILFVEMKNEFNNQILTIF